MILEKLLNKYMHYIISLSIVLLISCNAKDSNKQSSSLIDSSVITTPLKSIFDLKLLEEKKWKLVDKYGTLIISINDTNYTKKMYYSTFLKRKERYPLYPLLDDFDKEQILLPVIANDKSGGVEYIQFFKNKNFARYVNDSIPTCQGKWLENKNILKLVYNNDSQKYSNIIHSVDSLYCSEPNSHNNYVILHLDNEKLILLNYFSDMALNDIKAYSKIHVYINSNLQDKVDFDKDEFYVIPYFERFLDKQGLALKFE